MPKKIAVLLPIVAIATNLMFIIFGLGNNQTYVADWSYFNSISLVLRSSILQYHTFPLHDPWICGGIDLSANPNVHNFSPRLLLDPTFRTRNVLNFAANIR